MSSRFPWRREELNPPAPTGQASEQNRATDILSLRLSTPEPPPEFIYQRRPEETPEATRGRWVGPTIMVLLFAISLGVGVLVVRGVKDGLLAKNTEVPVIIAEEEPAKLRADEPVTPPASEAGAAPAAATEEFATPTPSDTLRRLLGNRTGGEPTTTASVEVPLAPGSADRGVQPEPAGYAAAPNTTPQVAAAPGAQSAGIPVRGGAAGDPSRYTIEIIRPTSLNQAKVEWARLQKAHPELLGDTTLELRRVALEGDTVVYRGLAGYMPNKSTAADFCAQISIVDNGQHCEVQLRRVPTQVAEVDPTAQAASDAPAADGNSSPFVAGASDTSVVRLVKLGLKRAGFDPGSLDGRPSAQLSAAIENYQERFGLPVDGAPSRDLLDHMLGEQVARIQPASQAPEAEKPTQVAARQPVAQPEPRPAVATPPPVASPPPQVAVRTPPAAPSTAVTAAVPPLAPAPAPASTGDDPGGAFILRGDEMLALGDIASARLFYDEAISLGSAAGKTALGRTYDPLFLVTTRISGPEPDPQRAATLYNEALAGGDSTARLRLRELESWMKTKR